jgi:hypothetical protein
MKAWVIVLGLFVLVGLGIVMLLIGIPVGLIILAYLTPMNTTISPSTLTISPVDGGECTVDEYCNIPVAEAAGGQEPYSYQSDSFATGAPPMGTIVDLNGHLTGKPTRAGEYDFGVCVADATRTSKCTKAGVTVTEDETPQTTIADTSSTTISSFTCTYKYTDSYGDKHYELSASGSATGPAGAELQLVFNPGYYTKKIPSCPECRSACGSWGASQMQTCARGRGPESTTWDVFVPASEVISGTTLAVVDNVVELNARIFISQNLMAETVEYATCPK